MILLLLLTSVHCHSYMEVNFTDKEIFIQNGDFGLYLFQAEEDYQVFVSGGNATAYPIESGLRLSYDGELKINNHSVNASIPPLLQLLLSPTSINSETLQLCYDFTTERVSLTVAIGILAVLFLASHGNKIRTTVKTLGEDLLQSKFARRVSRTGGSVAGSSTTYTPVEEEGCAWFSEIPETLYQTSTISRSEEVSEGVC